MRKFKYGHIETMPIKSPLPQGNWWANVTQIILFCCASLIVLWCTCGRLLVSDVKHPGANTPTREHVGLVPIASVSTAGEYVGGTEYVAQNGKYFIYIPHQKPTYPLDRTGCVTIAIRAHGNNEIYKFVFTGPAAKLHKMLYAEYQMKPPYISYDMPCTDFDRNQADSKSVMHYNVAQ